MTGELTVTDTDGTSKKALKRHDIDHAEETLAVFLAMDGNNKEAEVHLWNKAEKIAAGIRTQLMAPD